MAGLGYKLFASGEVLTAANLQGYAVDQSVMKFATTAARTAALAAPTQGMLSWIDATCSLEKYYELYNASTNTGGAKTAGWYPVSGEAMFFATATRSAATSTVYTVGSSGFSYTELIDTYAWHDASTNPDRITPNKEGIYRITHSCQYGGGGITNNRLATILKNGTTVATGYNLAASGNQPTGTYVSYMNGSTDYFSCQTYQSEGSTITVTSQVLVEYVRPSIS